jgi:CubicO group peptidase (beta-lactamase class C family)
MLTQCRAWPIAPCFAVVLLGTSAASAESLESRIDRLFEPWNAPASPGLSVAVDRDGEPIYEKTFGFANLTDGLSITADTRFNAGSIAKHVTAVAILTLENEGKLSLDDEIHRYLPELPDYGAPISIRQLLQQTSGLRDYRSLMSLAGWRSGDVQTNVQALRLIFRQHALNFPTGTSFIYSNTNFVLAAEIVARVTNQSFGVWAREHLFAPLGMTNTLVREDHAEVVPRLALSYRYRGDGEGFAEDLLDSSVVGAGNLITTRDDLLAWADYLLTAKLGGKALLDRLSQQATLPDGAPTGYGLGLFVGTHRGLYAIHHGGETAANRAYLMMFPEQGVRIVILSNAGSLRPEAAARAIADVVLEGELAAPLPQGESRVEPAAPLEAYTGLYELETGVLVEFGVSDGALYLIFGGTPARPVYALGGHSFGTDQPGVEFRFVAGPSGDITGLELSLGDASVEGRRIPRPVLGRDALEPYEGTYFSDELETFYHIEADERVLLARQLRLDDVRLEPIGNDRFREQPGGNLLVEFQRGRRGRIEGFDLSISRAQNIRFERQ